MIARVVSIVLASSLLAGGAEAGHGLSASFASIEWLPDAGSTPGGPLYYWDTWTEDRYLAAASHPRKKLDLALEIAREKLAELEAMVAAEDEEAANVALERYRAVIGGARDAFHRSPKELAPLLCQALLEHQYILSVDYETLPPAERDLLIATVEFADAVYVQAEPELAREDREPFTFKRNEVRWSVKNGMGAISSSERSETLR